ncbi:hypothetical protein TWF481_002048 [Arthrobotrys musiformis]|uniref:Uncharacterized protein n=1 Tax=Arthrobotrys musiformis TaxID=47236 RepID=A0AAV9VS81_9PEZI
MDRLLRRKPVKPAKPDQYVLRDPSYYQPSQLQLVSKGGEEHSSLHRPPAYHENAEKSAESAVAASQTIRSLEATYNRRSSSLSYPSPKAQTGEFKAQNEQNHPQQSQENAHLRRRSTTRTASTNYGAAENAAANGHRGSRSASESTSPHSRTLATNSEASNAYQSHNEASYPSNQVAPASEGTRSLRSTRHSRHSVDDKQPHAAWTRLSGFNRFEDQSPTSPVSPTLSPNPSIRPPSFADNMNASNPSIRPPSFAENTNISNPSIRPPSMADNASNAPQEDQPKTARQLFKEKIQWSTESQLFIPESSPSDPLPGTESDIPPWARTTSPVSVQRDDDDLSSICSEDSYVEKERTKYYESMVTEAVNLRDWKAAKGHAAKLKEILGLQKEHSTLDLHVQANYFLLCATIHYMLAELEDALFWVGKIPPKKSTDPSTLMNRFNMEAAIAIRQGNLNEAFAISRKSGKYGRKFGLEKETNHAHYLSQLICLKRDDTSEAQFYGQMITEKDFKLPIFIETIDTPMEDESAKPKRTPDEVYPPEPLPEKPNLPPKKTPNLGEALFAKAGLTLRVKSGGLVRPGSRPPGAGEYQGGTTSWALGIHLAVEADDDSESACYLYRTVYVNDSNMSSALSNTTGPSDNKPTKSMTPLEYAIAKYKTFAAIAIINQGKAKLEGDNFDAQPLQIATGQGNLPVMVALLKAGVDLNKVGLVDKVPPLEKAAMVLFHEGCKYLLADGADPLKHSSIQRNALKVALQGNPSEQREKIIKSMLRTLKSPQQYSTVAEYLKAFLIKRDLGSPESAHPKSFLQPNPVWNGHIVRLLSEYLDTFSHLKQE